MYRKASIKLEQTSNYDYDGNYNRFQLELKSFMNFKNNWWVDVGFGYKPRIFINTFLRGGPRWRYSDENFMFLFFGSDQSKNVNFTVGLLKVKQNKIILLLRGVF